MPPKKRAATSDDAVDAVAEFNKLVALPVAEDLLARQVSVPDGKRCVSAHLQPDSLLYRPARIVVLQKRTTDCRVRNQELYAQGEDGDWTLGTALIDSQCWSPDQYSTVVEVTMTEMARKIKEEVGDCICKVEFTKVPDPSEMAQLLQEGAALIEQSGCSAAEKKKMYKRLHERTSHGNYRILRGYILRAEDQQRRESETGMIKFIDADLMAQGKHCERMVNVRTVKALTLKLVKYVLK